MKCSLLLLTAISIGLTCSLSVDAQKKKKTSASQQKATRPGQTTKESTDTSAKPATAINSQKEDKQATAPVTKPAASAKSAGKIEPNHLGVDKIKKKNGQIVDGKINGLVVLKQKGTTTYSVIKGEYIESIDENGVHLRAGSKFLRLVTPDDKDEAGDIGFANSFFSGLGSLCSQPGFFGNIGGTSGVCLDGKELSATDILLGVLKRNEKDRSVIALSLDIVTATETVTVPISEIVDFKEKVEKPK